MSVCQCACMCITCRECLDSQEGSTGCPGPELQTFASCHVGAKNWSWGHFSFLRAVSVFNHWDISLAPICQYFIENFCFYVYQGDKFLIFFCVCVAFWFWCQGNISFIKSMKAFHSFLFHRLIWVALMFARILQWIHLVLGFLFCFILRNVLILLQSCC